MPGATNRSASSSRAISTANLWGYLGGKEAYGAMLFATALTNESIADALAMPAYRDLYISLAREILEVEVDARPAVAAALVEQARRGVLARSVRGEDGLRQRPREAPLAVIADGGHDLQLLDQCVDAVVLLDDELAVVLTRGEPARLPVGGDAEAEPVGVDLLSHLLRTLFLGGIRHQDAHALPPRRLPGRV